MLGLVATGLTNAAIGRALFLSEATVARHVHNVLVKLGMANRAEAAAWAALRGIVPSIHRSV